MVYQQFKRIEQIKPYEEVAQQIKQAIVEGFFSPGDRLPSHQQLMEQFNVSKSAISAAIRKLEEFGLIYTKVGSQGGTFVAAANTEAFTKSFTLLIDIKQITLRELTEFRLPLECQAAYLAAQRRSDKNLTKMKNLLDMMRDLLNSNGPIEKMVHFDTSFHIEIASASTNPLYLAMIQTLKECYLMRIFPLTPEKAWNTSYADFLKIYKAINNREAGEAEKAIKEHIEKFDKLVVSEFKQKHPEIKSFVDIRYTDILTNR